MLLNNARSSIAGWNGQMVSGLIDSRLATSYRTMLTAINSLCQQDRGTTFPILVHGYDYPVPDGRGFLGGWGPLPGPWLQPGFHEKLFDDPPTNAAMMQDIMGRFNTMLQSLIAEPEFSNVHYVDLRGTLSSDLLDQAYKSCWDNELHPTSAGFPAVAARFAAVLSGLP